MDTLWPNDDGRSWTYEQTYSDAITGQVIQNTVRLLLDGRDVVPGGIAVQNLRLDGPGGATKQLGQTDGMPAELSPFLATLWRSRPDLRVALDRHNERTVGQEQLTDGFHQLLIGEAAYSKTEHEISAYRRDVEATRSWLWLVSDLTIGNTFALQLVPDLADDVWLYGTITMWEAVTVPAGVFPECLRVDYRIDYGEAVCLDEYGQGLGGYRSETRGWIDYAPDVGPVSHYEEWIPFADFLWGNCPWQGYLGVAFTFGSLRLSSEQPTAVGQTSWGQIKGQFR
jgi:hypothetical protein